MDCSPASFKSIMKYDATGLVIQGGRKGLLNISFPKCNQRGTTLDVFFTTPPFQAVFVQNALCQFQQSLFSLESCWAPAATLNLFHQYLLFDCQSSRAWIFPSSKCKLTFVLSLPVGQGLDFSCLSTQVLLPSVRHLNSISCCY